MRNKWMALMTAAVLAISLVGCGGGSSSSSRNEELQNELGLSDSEYDELVSALAEETSSEAAETSAEVESTEPESTEVESAETELVDWSGYEPTEEIQNASLKDGKIQIADTVYEKYIPLSEFLKKVDSSEVNYCYYGGYGGDGPDNPYEPDSLVLSGEGVGVYFYLNCENADEKYADYDEGEKYIFCISADNLTSDTITAKECYVTYIGINTAAFGWSGRKYYDKDQVVTPGGIYYGGEFDITGANIATYSEGKQILEAEAQGEFDRCYEEKDNNGNIKITLETYQNNVECPEIGIGFGNDADPDDGNYCTFNVYYDPSTGQIASILDQIDSGLSMYYSLE